MWFNENLDVIEEMYDLTVYVQNYSVYSGQVA